MENRKTDASTGLRCGQIFYLSQSQAIDEALSILAGMIPAEFVLLTTNSGQTLSVSGKLDQADPIALGALVASDMAANQEMARLTGKSQDYSMILRESTDVNTWIVDAGLNLLMMVIVSANVPLGWTRLMIRRGIKSIADIADAPIAENPAEFSLEIDPMDLNQDIEKSLEVLWSK